MSVQAGIWNLQGEPVDRELLARISHSLAEYGPDGETTFFHEPVGFLYRPLHTTTESRGEHQPFVSMSGRVLTWDGRLDNRDELILQLRYELKDDLSDVALVATAFDRWGTGCFAKLIGDWAIAIWDPREKELVLSRDYIGIRHLFYYAQPEQILWCNHLSPLALCGDRLNLCDEYVAGYLTTDPDTHLTPYREIHSVPPGKFVRLRAGKTSIQAYWEFNSKSVTRYKTDGEYEEQYRNLFRQAVRRRLRTDSSILADLSGGFDSSSIVCMADDILAKEGAETAGVDTFSYYDPNEPGSDDLDYLTKVEQRRGKTGFHAALKTSGDSFCFEYPAFSARPGLLLGDIEEVKAALSEVLKQHAYRVRLSGNGGDDVNGQGLDPRIHMASLLLQFRLLELVRHITVWSLFMRKRPWIQLFFQTMLQLIPLPIRASLAERGKIEPWIDSKFARKHRISSRQIDVACQPWFVHPQVREAVRTVVSLSQRLTCTEPSVIEIRSPYLDQHLVEFLMTIPCDQLLRPGQQRSLMKRALADLLPPEILARKTKTGFARCYSIVLQKHWDSVDRTLSSALSSYLGYVNIDREREALLAMKNGQLPTTFPDLLKALSLELWLRDVNTRGVVSVYSSRTAEGGREFDETRGLAPLS